MIEVRKRTNGKPRYRARFRLANGRERSKSFARKHDAEVWLAEQKVDRNRGSQRDPAGARILFQSRADTWLEQKRHKVRRATWVRDSIYVHRELIPAFGAMKIGAIDRTSVQTWIHGLTERGLAARTVRENARIASSIFAEAVEDRLIPESPCRKLTLPKIEHREKRFLNADELALLADTIDPHYRALVLTAGILGARWGELSGLKRERLSLDLGTVEISGTIEDVGGVAVYVEDVKSDSSRRTISVPPRLLAVLRAHLAEAPPAEFVFVGKQGGLLRRGTFRTRYWLPAVREAGLEPLRFHDLRHTAAGLLIAERAHPLEIQRRLGHRDITTTMNVYGHLLPSLDVATTAALDSTLGQALDDAAKPRPKDARPNLSLVGAGP